MLTFQIVEERLSDTAGVDIEGVSEFIEEMSQAKTSTYYTAERRDKYRSLNIEELICIMNVNSSDKIRIGIMKNKILNLNNTQLITDSLYF